MYSVEGMWSGVDCKSRSEILDQFLFLRDSSECPGIQIQRGFPGVFEVTKHAVIRPASTLVVISHHSPTFINSPSSNMANSSQNVAGGICTTQMMVIGNHRCHPGGNGDEVVVVDAVVDHGWCVKVRDQHDHSLVHSTSLRIVSQSPALFAFCFSQESSQIIFTSLLHLQLLNLQNSLIVIGNFVLSAVINCYWFRMVPLSCSPYFSFAFLHISTCAMKNVSWSCHVVPPLTRLSIGVLVLSIYQLIWSKVEGWSLATRLLALLILLRKYLFPWLQVPSTLLTGPIPGSVSYFSSYQVPFREFVHENA